MLGALLFSRHLGSYGLTNLGFMRLTPILIEAGSSITCHLPESYEVNNQNIEGAGRLFQSALTLSPTAVAAKWGLFLQGFVKGDFEGPALQLLARSSSGRDSLAAELIQRRVEACNRDGSYTVAERLVRRTLQDGVVTARLYELLAVSLNQQNSYAEAIAAYEAALAIKPELKSHYLLQVAQIDHDTGEDGRAKDVLLDALAASSESAPTWQLPWEKTFAHLLLGDIARLQGHSDEALPHYYQVAAEDSGPWLGYSAWQRIGDIQLLTGKYDDALASLQKAITCSPSSPWPYVSLGQLYSEMGDSQQALSSYERAQSLASGAPDLDFLGDRIRSIQAQLR